MTTPIPLSFRPSSDEELLQCLMDPYWRLCSGALYSILTKSQGVIPFSPNDGQTLFMRRLWFRNVILKARQRGFTTLIALLWLDHSLFVPDQRCGMVAHDRDSAEELFRDKVKLAYDHLPPFVQRLRPLVKETSTELHFRHSNTSHSSIRVATSVRSGTIHRLHVSEYGKICARYPEKAAEVMNGSLPAVPADGIVVIESTAEGKDGDFHKKADLAEKNASVPGRVLLPQEYRFHFSAWWEDPGYVTDAYVPIGPKDEEYFTKVEATIGRHLSLRQKRWWVAERDNTFSGDDESMWQEYPSYPAEAFQVSTEGVYYAKQLAAVLTSGRRGHYPYVPGVVVDSWWDIGHTDGTAVWLTQEVAGYIRVFGFIEGWGEPYEYFTLQMQERKCMWRTHYLPHDAEQKRQLGTRITSPKQELEALSVGGKWKVVPAVDRVIHGIQSTRKVFPRLVFDEEGTKDGWAHLEAYRKTWNAARGDWSDEPRHDIHSEAADALRQLGQTHGKVDRPAKAGHNIPVSQRNFQG